MRAKLPCERTKNPREHIAGTALCQPGIPSGVDEYSSIGPDKNRMEAFKQNLRVPTSGSIGGNSDAILLNFSIRDAEQPRHFSGMRRDREQFRVSFAKSIAITSKCNLRCDFCFHAGTNVPEESRRPQGMMTYERFAASKNLDDLLKDPYWTSGYVSTGAFRLTSFDPGAGMDFEAYNGYFLGRPKIDVIHLRIFNDDATLLSNKRIAIALSPIDRCTWRTSSAHCRGA